MSEVTASAERERSSRVLQGGRVVLMSGTYRFLYTYNTSHDGKKVIKFRVKAVQPRVSGYTKPSVATVHVFESQRSRSCVVRRKLISHNE